MPLANVQSHSNKVTSIGSHGQRISRQKIFAINSISRLQILKTPLYASLVLGDEATPGHVSLSCHGGFQGDKLLAACSSLVVIMACESLSVIVSQRQTSQTHDVAVSGISAGQPFDIEWRGL